MMIKGFSLIEILVALGVFVILALFTTQSLATILQTRNKAEVTKLVRQEADYAVGVMERHLRAAKSVTCGLDGKSVNYKDPDDNSGSFSCQGTAPSYYIASGSANLRLTSSDVSITNCSSVFSCSPNSVTISFTAAQATQTTDPREKSSLQVSSQVILRNQ